MSDIAIKVEGLSKQYKIGSRQNGYKTLRESIANAASSPFRRLSSIFSRSSSVGISPQSIAGQPSAVGSPDPSVRGQPSLVGLGQSSVSGRRSAVDSETLWALKNISFEVQRGEVVGIIGRNGAGKSTLLKILSRITEPTEGYAEIRGRVGSLLEVGTGFHAELSGRENIHLNAAILGMRKAEIVRKFDEIVAFAEIEKFIDTPVKHYSSGMYVRLAFAVAAHLEHDILMVDEVLAVGDIEFQNKCLGKMEAVAKRGRTIILVSHNMIAVESICARCILIEDGAVLMDKNSAHVITRYLEGLKNKAIIKNRNGEFNNAFSCVRLEMSEQMKDKSLTPWLPCYLESIFYTNVRLEYCFINLIIDDMYGRHCIHLRTDYDGLFPDFMPGKHIIRVEISSLNLEGGTYLAWFRLASNKSNIIIDSEKLIFNVTRKNERFEAVGAVVAVKHSWNWSSCIS